MIMGFVCRIYKVTASGCGNETLCQIIFVFPKCWCKTSRRKKWSFRNRWCLNLGLIVKPLGIINGAC